MFKLFKENFFNIFVEKKISKYYMDINLLYNNFYANLKSNRNVGIK